MRAAVSVASVAFLVVAVCGCESTVDAARKISRQGTKAFQATGLAVTRTDRRIHVLSTAVIQDPNGTAAVVELRDAGSAPMVNAPISISVRDRAGKSVFENNSPGVEYDLTHVPLLLPGQAVAWVDDQVLPAGTPSSVVARIGAGSRLRGALPQLQVGHVTLTDDAVSGYAASGQIHNASKIAQSQLVVFAIARRGKRIVAAGRAIITRLAPGKTTTFHAYFLGNPRGAQITVSAPPSDLA